MIFDTSFRYKSRENVKAGGSPLNYNVRRTIIGFLRLVFFCKISVKFFSFRADESKMDNTHTEQKQTLQRIAKHYRPTLLNFCVLFILQQSGFIGNVCIKNHSVLASKGFSQYLAQILKNKCKPCYSVQRDASKSKKIALTLHTNV